MSSFAYETTRTPIAPVPAGPETQEAVLIAERDRREELAFRWSPIVAAVAVGLAWWIAPSAKTVVADESPPILSIPVPKGITLVVVDGENCEGCRAFYRDIVPTYRHSGYGAQVPLRTVGVRDQSLGDFQLKYPARAVPSFILIGPDDVEVDRIDAYPGSMKAFYASLDLMLLKVGARPARRPWSER
jgi:hypothetical protein